MEIENLNLQKQINEMIDKIYPIGSYYETSDPNFDPNVEWGGTWIKDSKGLVTIGAYANGESGDNSYVNTYIKQGEIIGENEHQLTINEIPSHNHRVNELNDGPGKYPNWGNESGWGVAAQNMNGNGGQSNTAYTGNGESHNIIQPSIGVYRWHRITPSFTLEYTDRNSTHHSETILSEEELKSRIQEINIEQEGQRIQRNLKTCKIISNGVKIKDCSGLFSKCEGLTSVDLSELDTSEATDMSTMFTSCNGLVTLDLSTLNTSNVTDMGAMFSYCQNLTELDLSNFDTSNVTNMTGMFYYCDDLTTLKLSKFNTSNVRDMGQMFYRCQKLTGLDLLTFDTQNVKTMESMFYCCYDLKSLDLSSFNTSNVIHMNNMFYWCESLTSLDIQNFDFSKITITGFNKMLENIPSNCLITVKDQVAKNFVLSIRSDLTNVQIKS